MSDQSVTRPPHRHRAAQTQNKHTLNIHALSGIRTHNHSVRASEDSLCLRKLGYRGLPTLKLIHTPVGGYGWIYLLVHPFESQSSKMR
jgi:hypothetical protein